MVRAASLIRSAALLLPLMVTGCDRSPVQPSPPVPVPGIAVPTSLRITGPGTVAPGESIRFTATSRFSDGAIQDVTGIASWISFRTEVAEARANGEIAGRSQGIAMIGAELSGFKAYEEVIVLERGTYWIGGMVTDASTRLLIDAQIVAEEEDGTRRETWHFPGDLGYTLIGVKGGRVRLTASNSSGHYISQSVEIVLKTNTIQDFVLSR